MNKPDLEQFESLLSAVEACYREKHPSCTKHISEWTGNEIAGFQVDLRENVKEQISEKWFYTHIKTGKREKLPRIDVLNMLSRYCGYSGWQEYVWKNPLSQQADKPAVPDKNVHAANHYKTKKKKLIMASVLILLIFSFIAGWKYLHKEATYLICFYDADKNLALINVPIEISMLTDNESPVHYKSDSCGCFEFPVSNHTLQFIVKAPYFKTDTIRRNPDKAMKKEIVKLKTDDYALMIHIFSRSDISDWKSRRLQLHEMIDENAKIFQIDSANTGMEMYNKTEFIDKMTMPLNSLKNIEILEAVYNEEKIIYMRFIQKI